MPQPTILATSFDALARRISHLRTQTTNLSRLLTSARRVEEQMHVQGYKGTEIEAVMDDLMDTALTAIGDDMKEALDQMPWDYNRRFLAGYGERDTTNELLAGAVSVSVTVATGTITAVSAISGTGFFDQFDASDTVVVKNAKDTAHDGTYTVSSRTSTTLVLGAMSGSDTTLDISMEIYMKQRA